MGTWALGQVALDSVFEAAKDSKVGLNTWFEEKKHQKMSPVEVPKLLLKSGGATA